MKSLLFFFVCALSSVSLLGQDEAYKDRMIESLRQQTDPTDPRKLQSLLLKPEVQQELGIDRNTYGMVSEAMSELRAAQTELMKEAMSAQADPNASREFLEKMRKLGEERAQATREALSEIFPPKSFERLRQVAYRIQIAEVGMMNALVYGSLASELEMDEAQWKELADKGAAIEAERQEKIREIEKIYDEKLLSKLTSTQRKKLDALIGEPLESVPASRERQSFERLKQMLSR